MAARPTFFKTVLVGEGGVGKTSLVVRYTENRFDDAMKMTIGANIASKRIDTQGYTVTLILWDLGGQPRFHDVVQDYFRGARLAFAVYDATRAYTLDRLDDWIQRVNSETPSCDFVIVGNKSDERIPCQGVTKEDALAFASRYNADCMEVSAKSGEGVAAMFEMAAAFLVKKHLPAV